MLLAHTKWGPPSGKTALLLHGGCSARSTWADVGPWLADRGWHVIALDLRGHGDSTVDPPSADRSVRTMAVDVIETVAAVCPDTGGVELLVGHSLGCVVSLACLAARPSFARRLVLEDPPGPGMDFGLLADRALAIITAARADPDGYAALVQSAIGRADDVSARIAAVGAADPNYVPAVMAAIAKIDLTDLFARCGTPTLLLVGRDKGEPYRPGPEEGVKFSALSGVDRARVCSALRDGTLVQLDAGHDLHGLCFEEFVAALEHWLAGGR